MREIFQYIFLGSFLTLSSCNPFNFLTPFEGDFEEGNNESFNEMTHNSPENGQVKNQSLEPQASVRTLEQLEKLYSNLTGINMAHINVHSEFRRVRTSLPSTNDINAFTAFNQVSITALAMRVCEHWVDNNFSSTGPLDYKVLGVQRIGNPNYKDDIIDVFYNKLAHTLEEDDPFLSATREEIKDIMDISSPDSVIRVTLNNIKFKYKYEVVLGCGFFLSTPYFTLDGY